ncbi:pimeloyl-ACP methyl ester carboxylesterase [Rhodoblastus acidophilus]|uniref:alpha/beta fold hydrolase n=1 Tax=Rhodoblastus acidophilus TaxID=1074 RepID=UPI0022252557|nr:alpha/beta hydrolase [Rhodoblastus acidophilus]MCW2284121.1 pimeloyl-ACP methyl ester carboxylesterase [Rhodoblastus acidophilus]MCW2332817.1 pimeloyl-ACP methyl ester carboxylesterase [Rhodoblastus acidophilus]
MTNIVTADAARADATASVFRTQTRLGPVEHTDDGDGPAFLALHGGMGGYDQSLLLAKTLLAAPASQRVIALSRPGYLGAPLLSGATLDEHADLYAALLDRLAIDRAVVAAVSAGGPSAIAFAARHPDRCAGLILVSTPSGRFDSPDEVVKRLRHFEILCRIPGVARFFAWANRRNPRKAAARAIRDPDTLQRTLAHPEAARLLFALQGSVFERLAERLPGTIADVSALAALPPLPFHRISSPTLVIHGEADSVVPFAHGRRSAHEIAGAEFCKIPAGEHVCLFTHLDEVRQRVGAFLRRAREEAR